MANFLQLILIYTCLLLSISFQCKDHSGSNIDWWILLKVPQIIDDQGVKYAFISEQKNSIEMYDNINDQSSPLVQTLSQIESISTSNNFASIFWNDQPQTGAKSMSYAHAKGVIGAESVDSFIMIHSCPNFTYVMDNNKISLQISGNNYKYGQHFFCISVKTDVINQYAYQLLIDWPYIYPQSFVPDNLQNLLPNLKTLTNKNWRDRISINESLYKFKSLNGHYFYKFTKSRQYIVPFYDTIISPNLKVDFVTETWGNGRGGLLDPNCTETYKTVSNLVVQLQPNISYKESYDHSKYGTAISGDNFTCLGDINRMESQFERGGGTICVENSKLNSIFQSILSTRQECPNAKFLEKRK